MCISTEIFDHGVLASAIAKAINENGEQILDKKKLITVLDSYNGFSELYESKKILKILLNIHGLKKLYSIKEEKARIVSQCICHYGDIIKHGNKFTDNALSYTFKSIIKGFTEHQRLSECQLLESNTQIEESTKILALTEKNSKDTVIGREENDNSEDNCKKQQNILELRNILYETHKKKLIKRAIINWLLEKSQDEFFNRDNIFNTITQSIKYIDPFMGRIVKVHVMETNSRTEIAIDYGHYETIASLRKDDALNKAFTYLDVTYGLPSVVLGCDIDEYVDYVEKWMKKYGKSRNGLYSIKLKAYCNEWGTALCTFDYSYSSYTVRIRLIDKKSESVTEDTWRKEYKTTFDVIYPSIQYPSYSYAPEPL